MIKSKDRYEILSFCFNGAYDELRNLLDPDEVAKLPRKGESSLRSLLARPYETPRFVWRSMDTTCRESLFYELQIAGPELVFLRKFNYFSRFHIGMSSPMFPVETQTFSSLANRILVSSIGQYAHVRTLSRENKMFFQWQPTGGAHDALIGFLAGFIMRISSVLIRANPDIEKQPLGEAIFVEAILKSLPSIEETAQTAYGSASYFGMNARGVLIQLAMLSRFWRGTASLADAAYTPIAGLAYNARFFDLFVKEYRRLIPPELIEKEEEEDDYDSL